MPKFPHRPSSTRRIVVDAPTDPHVPIWAEPTVVADDDSDTIPEIIVPTLPDGRIPRCRDTLVDGEVEDDETLMDHDSFP